MRNRGLSPIMRTRLMKILFIPLAVIVAFCTWQTFVKYRYEAAFDRTSNGDTVATVIANFGNPSKRGSCPKANPALTPNHDVSHLFPNCKSQFTYLYILSYFDLGTWIIEFDEQDRVSGKAYLVLQ